MPFIVRNVGNLFAGLHSADIVRSIALSIQYTIIAFLTSHGFGRGQQRQWNVQINRDLKRTPRRACCGLRVLRWQGAAHILIYYNRNAVYGHG